MAIDSSSPRTRRALLGAGLGALAATASSALGGSAVSAAGGSVRLGAGNTETAATTFTNNTANGTAVSGVANTGTSARGLSGHSTSGKGVQGVSTSGSGVYGASTAGYGVQGESPHGGVYGHSSGNHGVAGSSAAVAAAGVYGESTTAGHGYGLRGHASGTHGVGVYAESDAGDGVFGQSSSGSDYGVHGEGAGGGVYGHSGTANGVYGESAGTGGYGIAGHATGANGVGVRGETASDSGYGVQGYASGANATGVYGAAPSADGFGVYGAAMGSGGIGVRGDQGVNASWAGYFHGPVTVTGTFTSPSHIIQLDHPDAPADRYFQRAPVAAFELLSVVGGNAVTGAAGKVTVRVPALFARHHTDVRYQLTAVGGTSQLFVAEKLDSNGRFVIAADRAGLEVSWQLTGVRTDRAALKQPLRVDSAKPARYRGRYIQPSLYGLPRSTSLVAPRPAPNHALAPSRPR